MKIEVRFHELEASSALQSHAERQVHFHLSRFGTELESVVVRLSSMKGVDGTTWTHCRVTVRGARLRSITLAEQGDDPVASLTTLLERTGRKVGRALHDVRICAQLRWPQQRTEHATGSKGNTQKQQQKQNVRLEHFKRST